MGDAVRLIRQADIGWSLPHLMSRGAHRDTLSM